jgi:hypothetical protein
MLKSAVLKQGRIFKMNKERIKFFALGFVLCAVLSASVMAVTAQTVTRNITYGVGVVLNGRQVAFDNDSRPFVMDGRTFLPLRTLAELLDLPVDFDPLNNNAIIGHAAEEEAPAADTSTPLAQLFSEGIPHHGGQTELRDGVMMNSTRYNGAVLFGAVTDFSESSVEHSAVINLDGEYNWFSGIFGRVDGAARINASVSIYADDSLIHSFELPMNAMPTEFRVSVSGVDVIRFEVTHHLGSRQTANFALSGAAE